MKVSTTYVANIVAIIVFILPLFGLKITNTDALSSAVAIAIGIASSLYVFYGRYKAGGINAFGIRIKK